MATHYTVIYAEAETTKPRRERTMTQRSLKGVLRGRGYRLSVPYTDGLFQMNLCH